MSTTAHNPVDPCPFPVRPFSIEEYHRLGELGILSDDDAVELLSGWIVPKMIHNPRHDAAVELVDNSLRTLLPDGWRIRIQSAITTDDSEPEPDLAIVRGSIRDHVTRHPAPGEIAMLVEVADSSLQRDRLKASVYARAGIPVYWIVNLLDSQLEVYTEPSTAHSEYQNREVLDGQQAAVIRIGEHSAGSTLVRDLLP